MAFQIPSGQVNPGLSFFRAMQEVAERPRDPGQVSQTKAASAPVDAERSEARPQPDVQQANRPADPAEAAARAAESGRNLPRGSFLDISV